MAQLQGFASHWSSVLSGSWLDTVQAPGYPRQPLPMYSEAALNFFIQIPKTQVVINVLKKLAT